MKIISTYLVLKTTSILTVKYSTNDRLRLWLLSIDEKCSTGFFGILREIWIEILTLNYRRTASIVNNRRTGYNFNQPNNKLRSHTRTFIFLVLSYAKISTKSYPSQVGQSFHSKTLKKSRLLLKMYVLKWSGP